MKTIKNHNPRVKVSAKAIGDVLDTAEQMERIAHRYRSENDRLGIDLAKATINRDWAILGAALSFLSTIAIVTAWVLS